MRTFFKAAELPSRAASLPDISGRSLRGLRHPEAGIGHHGAGAKHDASIRVGSESSKSVAEYVERFASSDVVVDDDDDGTFSFPMSF
jgi:hypothetical protein